MTGPGLAARATDSGRHIRELGTWVQTISILKMAGSIL